MLKNNNEKGYIMGYINAAKLCALAGKRFDHWLANKESKEMVRVSSESKKNNTTITVKGGRNSKITGTYVHPDLIPYIILWSARDHSRCWLCILYHI